MHGIVVAHGGSSLHTPVARLSLPVAVAKAAQHVLVRAVRQPSLQARSGRQAALLSERASLGWKERSYRYSLFFDSKRQEGDCRTSKVFASYASKIKKTLTLENRAPTIMATLSVAAHEGGRQLRRRKETQITVSSTQVASSIMDNSKQNRKKLARAADTAWSTYDDEEPVYSKGESFATDLEARLWNLDKSGQLASLTVVELRGLMKDISKPTAGRKEELISEVKNWLAERQALSSWKIKMDGNRVTQEFSSDADSLEGALLKAENKSRQLGALSPMVRNRAGSNVRDTSEKHVVEEDPQTLIMDQGNKSLRNGEGINAINLPRAAPKRRTAENVRSVQRGINAQKDFEPTGEGDGEPGTTLNGNKSDEHSGKTMDEVSVKTSVTGQKRKIQISKITQSKKGKGSDGEEELLSMKSAELEVPWKMLVHKKPRADWVAYNPDAMRPAPPPPGTKTMKLVSWNVNGLRALVKDKGKVQEALLLTKFAKEEDFDVLCLQETKLQEKDVEQFQKSLPSDYDEVFWSCSTAKLGYAGTAVFSRVKPVSVKYGMEIADHDSEGRLITVEFDTFFLLTSYVPNAGEKLQRLSYRTQEWDPALSRYIKKLEKQKPVVLCGDLNCANEEIDIHNPNQNRKSAGFTDEERASFKENFLSEGLVDTFRHQHPFAVAYTYWGYRFQCRQKNMGWRLDYFLVSEAVVKQVHDSYICADVLGSDHCPIGLILKL